jgi:hypothetical protein
MEALGPAKAVDADLAGRVQRLLELDIERAGAEAAAVHRTEDLDVTYRIQAEALGDPVLHDRQQLSNTLFRRLTPINVAAALFALADVAAYVVNEGDVLQDRLTVSREDQLGLEESFAGQFRYRLGMLRGHAQTRR